jgi:hypothetical protein
MSVIKPQSVLIYDQLTPHTCKTYNIAGQTYYALYVIPPDEYSQGLTFSVSVANSGRFPWFKAVLPLENVKYIRLTQYEPYVMYGQYLAYTTGGTVYAEIDILIRKADGTVRRTLATGLSRSPKLGTTLQQLQGSNVTSFPTYYPEDPTDYFEIDFVANVQVKKAGSYAYIVIDDYNLYWYQQVGYTSVIGLSVEYWEPQYHTLTESLTLSDLAYKGMSVKVTDTLVFNDYLAKIKSMVLAEALTLSDAINILGRAIIKLVTDQFTVLDSVKIGKEIFTHDFIQGLDRVMVDKLLKQYEAQGLADYLRLRKDLKIPDALTSLDSTRLDKVITFSEQLSVLELVKTFKDIIIRDVLTSVEYLVRNKQLSVSDALTLAELLTIAKVFSIIESLGISEKLILSKILKVSDVLGISELLSKPLQVLKLADGLSINDIVLLSKLIVLYDSSKLNDVIQVSLGLLVKTVTESVTLSDSIIRDKSLVIQETIKLMESLIRDKVLTLSDAVELSEFILFSKLILTTEALSISHNDRIELIKKLALAEQLTITDYLLLSEKTAKIVDNLGLKDSLIFHKYVRTKKKAYIFIREDGAIYLIIDNFIFSLN